VNAQDSDVVLLDASPYASQQFNRFDLPGRTDRPASRRFDLPRTERYRTERVVKQEPIDSEPAWLRALSNAGIPVCTHCGTRNPMKARDCLECHQPLNWKRTRRIKLPLDRSADKLKLKESGMGFWGGALVALLMVQIAVALFMVSEAVWPQLLASF
jgi:ribosomal protein L40E